VILAELRIWLLERAADSHLHGIDPAGYLLAAVRAADRGEVLLPWQHTSRVDAR
jgi:hypothetical protein